MSYEVMVSEIADVKDAVEFIRKTESRIPEVGLILGSGLGAMADGAVNASVFDTAGIPGYPVSTVEGHSGELVFAELGGKTVVVVKGRVHSYEGHRLRKVTFPIRLLKSLGVSNLVVTNAAGGANPDFGPGTIMFITDHINGSFLGPLAGLETDGGPRFPDMSEPYDDEWRHKVEQFALQNRIATKSGTYFWTLGPSYETKAEVSAFRKLGADAIGMSTVPEVIQARQLDIKVLGISTITNAAAGLGGSTLNHEEVLEVGRSVRNRLERLVIGALETL